MSAACRWKIFMALCNSLWFCIQHLVNYQAEPCFGLSTLSDQSTKFQLSKYLT